MHDVREKLVALVSMVVVPYFAKEIADLLIANGVTFETDRNVGSKWIPVTERLPDDRGDVLVVAWWHEKWQAMTGWYAVTSNIWHILTPDGFFPWDHVTHWMPLPEAPKEDK